MIGGIVRDLRRLGSLAVLGDAFGNQIKHGMSLFRPGNLH